MRLGRFLWSANPHDKCAKSHVLHIYIHESSHLSIVDFIYFICHLSFSRFNQLIISLLIR